MGKILVTGAAGFIGFHVAQRLLGRGDDVLGVDNLNDYYEPSLKEARLAILQRHRGFSFLRMDIAAGAAVTALFAEELPPVVIHLAAQAGVRYSLVNPQAYVDSNITGSLNILEGCRRQGVQHLVFASSSSVYGANTRMPFSEHDGVDHPVSLYAATKRAGELMAHTYASLFGIPCTGLRFFTVYGPWGRPDMAYFRFTKAILAGKAIDVYNHGRMERDFTYIDDIVDGVVAVADRPPGGNPGWRADLPDPAASFAPFRIFNIGGSRPVEVFRLIEIIEGELGIRARMNFLPLQPGDVVATCADNEDLRTVTGAQPVTPLEEGMKNFVRWYRDYYTC
jgi:UDP-glucuronate 4-epimerase